MLRKRILKWAGHAARMPNIRAPKQIFSRMMDRRDLTRPSANFMSRCRLNLAGAWSGLQIPELAWLQIASIRNKCKQLMKDEHSKEKSTAKRAWRNCTRSKYCCTESENVNQAETQRENQGQTRICVMSIPRLWAAVQRHSCLSQLNTNETHRKIQDS